MSVADPIVSRRALLAAAVTGPLPWSDIGLIFAAAEAGDGPAAAPSAGAAAARRWESALARFRAAEAALASFSDPDDDPRFDRLLGRLNGALSALLRTPAPTPAALADKLDLLVAHEAWELSFAAPALAALRRDARRLAA